MKIVIDQTEYTAIRDLKFSPQVDLVCNALPINSFEADILTQDAISAGQNAELWDGDALWARYWIDYAEPVATGLVHVRARCELALISEVTLEGVMYEDEPLKDVLDATIVRESGSGGVVATLDYDLDDALESVTISGYCPEQTARERLQWVCFVIGAYVKTAFVEKITILPLDTAAEMIPIGETFWKPEVRYGDYVTGVRLTAYTFREDADAAEDNSSYIFPLPWVATTQTFELLNPSVPEGIAENVVEITDLYLINPNNVSALLTLLSTRYFARTEISADVLNDGVYAPGDKIFVHTDAETIYTGYIEDASFRFGRQARATLKVVAASTVETADLIVSYTYSGTNLATETYSIPVGYEYSVGTRYLDIEAEGHRIVYRPTVQAVSGTMTGTGASAAVPCEIALDYEGGVLSIYAVDEAQVGSDLYTMVIS